MGSKGRVSRRTQERGKLGGDEKDAGVGEGGGMGAGRPFSYLEMLLFFPARVWENSPRLSTPDTSRDHRCVLSPSLHSFKFVLSPLEQD